MVVLLAMRVNGRTMTAADSRSQACTFINIGPGGQLVKQIRDAKMIEKYDQVISAP
jgi:hypothetical protein